MLAAASRILIVLEWVFIAGVFGWFLWRWFTRTEDDRGWLISKWIISAIMLAGALYCMAYAVGSNPFLGVPFAAACAIVIGILWAPNVGRAFAKPLTSMFDGGDVALEPQPLYSTAEAQRKRGRYHEAIAEIQGQLAKFPGDFTGLMMLAEIHMEDLHDLAAAQQTVENMVTSPNRTPAETAYALNRLADWQLNSGHDSVAARQTLQRVRDLFPESEYAQVAAQRLAHMPSDEMVADQEQRRRLTVTRQDEYLGLREDYTGLKAPVQDPAEAVAACLKQLEQHPLDNEARERLASLYADQYGRLDLATFQLEELVRQPGQSSRNIVRWLNLLAEFQVRLHGDTPAARQTLERIIELFPKAAAAENARHRIAFLSYEAKRLQKDPALRLPPASTEPAQ